MSGTQVTFLPPWMDPREGTCTKERKALKCLKVIFGLVRQYDLPAHDTGIAKDTPGGFGG